MNYEDWGHSFEISPRAWYRNVLFELDLLRSYAVGVEKQIKDSITTFYSEKKEHTFEIDPEQGFADIVTTHQGLDDSTYHLETIFEDYFPNLQRRSALITLFSFLEYQLDELCRLFASDQKFSVSLDDLKDKGIDRSHRYLTKVVGLKIEKNTSTWQALRQIQSLRNDIVHGDGRLKNDDARRHAHESPFLSDNGGVSIKEGYLIYLLETFDRYFKEINSQIPRKKRTQPVISSNQ